MSGGEPGGRRALTVLEVLRRSEQWLRPRSPSARLDAELLVGHALGLDRVGVYLAHDRPLSDGETAQLRALVRARGGRRPVAYLTGRKEFYGLALSVDERVLVPRPETEGLVDRALELLPPGPVRVADVGTGSGAIACAIAHERDAAWVVATDVSPGAVAVAAHNAVRTGVSARVRVVRADLLAGVADGVLDLVASNPPYLADGDPEVDPGVAAHEPGVALFAGADGLAVLRRLLPAAAAALRPGGALVVELGADQAGPVAALAGAAGFEAVEVRRDLGGRPRVLSARRPPAAPC